MNLDFNEKRKKFTAVILLVLMVVVVIFIQINAATSGRVSFIEEILLTILKPFQKAANYTGEKFSKGLNTYVNIKEVASENDRLKKKVEQLAASNQVLQEEAIENKKMRELLSFRTRYTRKTIPAHVIGRDPTNWYKSLTIGKGELDGVKKDMVVVVPEGLVGKISYVSRRTATVLLILDKDNPVPALIRESRYYGVFYGSQTGVSLLKYVKSEADPQEGNTVITSGMGWIYPKGLVIGKILKVNKAEYSFYLDIKVKPEVDFDRLEHVLVISDEGE
jgi:rod shape-determining protein MreC